MIGGAQSGLQEPFTPQSCPQHIHVIDDLGAIHALQTVSNDVGICIFSFPSSKTHTSMSARGQVPLTFRVKIELEKISSLGNVQTTHS